MAILSNHMQRSSARSISGIHSCSFYSQLSIRTSDPQNTWRKSQNTLIRDYAMSFQQLIIQFLQ